MDVLWSGTPVVTLPGTVKFWHPWTGQVLDYQVFWIIRNSGKSAVCVLTWVLPGNFCYCSCTWATQSMKGKFHVDISFICWYRVVFCAFWNPCSCRNWW